MMKKLFSIVGAILLGGNMSANAAPSYPLDGFTAEQKVLVKAIQKTDVEQVKKLVKQTDLSLHDKKKSIPLLTVAMIEAMPDIKSTVMTPRLQIVTELMKAGASFTDTAGYSSSPLDIALLANPGLLLALLEGGLDPNYQEQFAPIIFRLDTDDKLESLKILIKYGADVNAKDSVGENPAHAAIKGIGEKISYYLVTQGSDVFNEAGVRTPRTFAKAVYNTEKTLIEDVNRIKNGAKGSLKNVEEKLEAAQKIKAIMIQKGIKWPPAY